MIGPAFAANPIGEPFDPEALAERLAQGRPVNDLIFRSDQAESKATQGHRTSPRDCACLVWPLRTSATALMLSADELASGSVAGHRAVQSRQFAAASRVSISSRNAKKSIGFVRSPLAPFSSALRLVSASP